MWLLQGRLSHMKDVEMNLLDHSVKYIKPRRSVQVYTTNILSIFTCVLTLCLITKSESASVSVRYSQLKVSRVFAVRPQGSRCGHLSAC